MDLEEHYCSFKEMFFVVKQLQGQFKDTPHYSGLTTAAGPFGNTREANVNIG